MMEKPSKMKSKILASLPKAASPVTFRLSSPLSPVRSAGRKGFLSPVVSIIPKEARRKPKNSSFEQREPGSPKVSCTGQVKNSKKKNMIKPKLVPHPEQKTTPISYAKELEKKKKNKLVLMMKIFKGGKRSDRVEVSVPDDVKAAGVAAERVPSLGGMKKFTSSRGGGVLENFDWRICEGRGEEQVEKVIVPCYTRSVLGGGQVVVEPQKEEKKDPPIPLET